MLHGAEIIVTFTAGLSAALVFGYITQKFHLSPIVGFILAGLIVGPFSPGVVADTDTAKQFAEIGVILLMFSVGMHFQLKDLVSVRKIALPGAVFQIFITTLFSMGLMHLFGWNAKAGLIFGIAISVASTVVLTRVLADNKNLYTPIGHLAMGWLIVEDLFTILVLVVFPVFVNLHSFSQIGETLIITIFKMAVLAVSVLILGRKIIPFLLGYVAESGARDLFTLAIMVFALGIAVIAAEFFGASIALGAFLAGMVIGQSDFSARAASEAFPMRDVFAVLFFVSVGMLFNPISLLTDWKLLLVNLFIVMIIKPLVAFIVVISFKNSLKKALYVSVALAQIGEFSFILASLAVSMNVLPPDAYNAIIGTAIISISLNPLIYKLINPLSRFLSQQGFDYNQPKNKTIVPPAREDSLRIIIVGYGPVGETISKKLLKKGLEVVVIEMNLKTVKKISHNNEEKEFALYGDASHSEILIQAGIENSEILIISSSDAPSEDIIEIAKALNPIIKIFIHTTFIKEAKALCDKGAEKVFSGEGVAASYLSKYILETLDSDGDFLIDGKTCMIDDFT